MIGYQLLNTVMNNVCKDIVQKVIVYSVLSCGRTIEMFDPSSWFMLYLLSKNKEFFDHHNYSVHTTYN